MTNWHERHTWKRETLCSCDPVDIVANVATGGLYSIAKGVEKAVTTGKILAGVADIMASAGIAGAFLQPTLGTEKALMIQGAVAGGALAAAPAGAVFSGGFGAATGGVSHAAAMPGAAGLMSGGPVTAASIPATGIPLAPGVAPTAAEVAGAGLNGTVGASSPGTGLFAQTTSNAPYAAMNEGVAGWGGGAATKIPSNPDAVKGWFESLPPLAQYGVITGGTKLVSGAAGGLFASMSAEQQLNLEKLINEQRQAQIQRLNTQNSYAPQLSFQPTSGPAGVLAAPR